MKLLFRCYFVLFISSFYFAACTTSTPQTTMPSIAFKTIVMPSSAPTPIPSTPAPTGISQHSILPITTRVDALVLYADPTPTSRNGIPTSTPEPASRFPLPTPTAEPPPMPAINTIGNSLTQLWNTATRAAESLKELIDPISPRLYPPMDIVYDSIDISDILSSLFKRTTAKFQLFSLAHDRLVSPFHLPVGNPIVVLIHGSNQENYPNTLFGWKSFAQYIEQNPDVYMEIDGLPIIVYQYDSSYSVSYIAEELQRLLDEYYQYSPVFLVGHSMGALVADATAHENSSYDPYRYGGIVGLAGALQGSPLVIPPLMKITFSYQAARDFLTAYYFLTMTNWGAYQTWNSTKSIKDLWSLFGDNLLTDGVRSLFYNGRNVPIPSGDYYIPGKFFPITLDAATRCGQDGDISMFFTDALLHHTKDVFGRVKTRYNYTDSLPVWKRAVGVVPDMILHAGYLTKAKQNMDELKTLIKTGAAVLNDYVNKKGNTTYEKQALRFLWTQFMFIPTGHADNMETDYCANDSMVSGDSAWNLSPGPNICSVSNGVISVNMDIVKQRCTNALACVGHKDKDHKDMADSQDPGYWKSVINSLAFFVKRYKKYYKSPYDNTGYYLYPEKRENILFEDEEKAIKDLFAKQHATDVSDIKVMRYNGGWQIRVDQYPKFPLLYYIKRENGKWRPSNAKELALIP